MRYSKLFAWFTLASDTMEQIGTKTIRTYITTTVKSRQLWYQPAGRKTTFLSKCLTSGLQLTG
jgi:hypothetical protein